MRRNRLPLVGLAIAFTISLLFAALVIGALAALVKAVWSVVLS